jgi:uncharacterized protein (TIGR00369 family)
LDITYEGQCFACGANNPIGLKLKFQFEGDGYVARFTPKPEHQGYDNITHGGIISTLLDEAMAKLVWAKGINAVTGTLNIRFRRPARIGEELTISGYITSEAHRVMDCRAEIKNPAGEVVAEATGRMVKVQPEISKSYDKNGEAL